MCIPYFQVCFFPKRCVSTVITLQVLIAITGSGRVHKIPGLIKVAMDTSQEEQQPNAFKY